MKLKTKQLISALSDCARAARLRPELPAFTGLKIAPDKQGIRLVKYCGSIVIERLIECEGGIDPVCVDYRKFSSVLDAFAKNEETELLTGYGVLCVKAGKSVIRFKSLPEDTVPEILHESAIEQSVSASDLSEGMKAAAFCVDTHATGSPRESVFVNCSEKCLDVVSFDGLRLAVFRRLVLSGKVSYMVPSSSAPSMALELAVDGAKIRSSDRLIEIYHKSGRGLFLMNEGKFINYNPMLEKHAGVTQITVDRDLMMGSVRKIEAIKAADCKTSVETLNGSLRLCSVGSDDDCLDEIPFDGSAEVSSIVTTRFLSEALNHMPAKFGMMDKEGSLYLSSGDLTCAIMARIKNG